MFLMEKEESSFMWEVGAGSGGLHIILHIHLAVQVHCRELLKQVLLIQLKKSILGRGLRSGRWGWRSGGRWGGGRSGDGRHSRSRRWRCRGRRHSRSGRPRLTDRPRDLIVIFNHLLANPQNRTLCCCITLIQPVLNDELCRDPIHNRIQIIWRLHRRCRVCLEQHITRRDLNVLCQCHYVQSK